MHKIVLTSLIFLVSFSTNAQDKMKKIKSAPFSIGETVEIHSKALKENRVLNIYLPHGYHPDSAKTYPVLYLLDGSVDEDFIHIAGLVQFGSFSWINMIPETIVVGIANVDRNRDFTYPTNDEEHKKNYPTIGNSAPFIDFIEKELQGFVTANYKTNGQKTLLGQSLGGLLATEILFKKPDLFDNFIIISPSLWWDYESLLKTTPMSYSTNKSIYIGVGKEGEIMERVAKELFEKLESSKKDHTSLFFGFFEKQDHGDVLHLAAYDAFEKMFRKKK